MTEDNKNKIKELNDKISNYHNKIQKIRSEIKEIEIGDIKSFLEGKYFHFGSYGSNGTNPPVELENSYIYVYPDDVFFLDKNTFENTTLVFNCMIFKYSTGTYVDDCWLEFDMHKQLYVHYSYDTVDRIKDSAKEITREEFIKVVRQGYYDSFKDLRDNV